jgi:thermostable 8-oxoguanine DNA glycosylase
MKIIWEFSESDINGVIDFVNTNRNIFVENRINRNIHRKEIVIDKDVILKTMLMCLLTSQQDSGPDSNLNVFLRNKSFLLTEKFLSQEHEIENVVQEVLISNGLKRYFNKIPHYFALNYSYLIQSNWELEKELDDCFRKDLTKHEERVFADKIDHIFKGFGSKQARNFLQSLGLTKYEIPIDSRIISWLKRIEFPVLFTPIALQDKSFYHFVSDGIQLLCEKANIYPCVLDAAIFSTNETTEWTRGKLVN